MSDAQENSSVVREEAPTSHAETIQFLEKNCMFRSSGVCCDDRSGVVTVVDGHDPGAKKGRNMGLLVVAIVAILGFGLFRYLRIRRD